MSDWFTHEEMTDLQSSIPELEIGETAHTHHCKEGHANDRCYITRNTDCVLFYCHHCGKHGIIREAYARVKQSKRELSNAVSTWSRYKPTLPRDTTTDVGEWHIKGRLWLAQAGITDQEIRDRGFGWSNSLGRVVLPIYDGDGKLAGYTARAVLDQEPKYLAKYTNKSTTKYHIPNPAHAGCVIVEDILSCVRVSRQVSCVAMLGDSVNDSLFHLLVTEYNKWWVWNDYDNPQVRLASHKLVQRLSIFGEVILVKTDQDPKCLTDAEIKTALNL